MDGAVAGAVAAVVNHQSQAAGSGPFDLVSLVGVLMLVLGVGLFAGACVRAFSLPRNMLFLCLTLFVMMSIAFYVGMYPVGMIAGVGIVATVIRNEIKRAKAEQPEA